MPRIISHALLTILRCSHHRIGYMYNQFLGSWEEFYNDYDWDELPKERSSDEEDVKAAAKALGYNEDAWDDDEEVSTDSLAWANLTTTEQEAAAVMGYDECLWDREILDETADTDAMH